MDLIIVAFGIVWSVVLFFAAGYANEAPNSKWKLLFIVPGFVCMVLSGLSGFEISMLPAYVSVIILAAGFFKESKRFRQMLCIPAILLLLAAIPMCVFNTGYRAPEYTKDFKKAFSAMKEHYVLSEYKKIDWDRLYAAYLPQFQEADKHHDEVEINIIWQRFCQEFHDGHVGWQSFGSGIMEETADRMFGSDYGLSLMTLENGDTVAVNVEEGSVLREAGIVNGTVVTAWNQVPIEDLVKNTNVRISTFPDEKNEHFYRALTAAGTGGESVTITFLDKDGKICNVEAPKLGSYAKRLEETVGIINGGVKTGNMEWSFPADNTACLRIKQMMYDSISYDDGNHAEMKAELRERILKLRETGTNKLIIDLRDNAGGSMQFVLAVAQLLAPKGGHSYIYEAVWDENTKEYKRDADGNYIVGKGITYQGEDLMAGGEIIILVNAATISAGDHLTMLLSEFDNVTVMGFTPSSGSGQAVNSIRFDYGILTYSDVPCLDSEGNIFIDTDFSRQSNMPLDVKVPFDQKAVTALFDEKKDYLLEIAVDVL